MPKSIKTYKDADKLAKYRKNQRKLNYDRGWIDSNNRPWTVEEDILITSSDKTDRDTSVEIHRSVLAIQVRRSRLKKMKNEFKLNNF